VICHNALFAGGTIQKIEDYSWSSPSLLNHTHEASEMENMFTAYLDTWLRAQTCDVADGAVRIGICVSV